MTNLIDLARTGITRLLKLPATPSPTLRRPAQKYLRLRGMKTIQVRRIRDEDRPQGPQPLTEGHPTLAEQQRQFQEQGIGEPVQGGYGTEPDESTPKTEETQRLVSKSTKKAAVSPRTAKAKMPAKARVRH